MDSVKHDLGVKTEVHDPSASKKLVRDTNPYKTWKTYLMKKS